MVVIDRTILQEGYGTDGKSLVLAEAKNGYAVFFYTHAEDRYSLICTADTETEAQEKYRREVVRHEIQDAILRCARRRVARGATVEHIQAYQQKLLNEWRDPEIVTFIEYLDRIVFPA